jgi:hypothetical protein
MDFNLSVAWLFYSSKKAYSGCLCLEMVKIGDNEALKNLHPSQMNKYLFAL